MVGFAAVSVKGVRRFASEASGRAISRVGDGVYGTTFRPRVYAAEFGPRGSGRGAVSGAVGRAAGLGVLRHKQLRRGSDGSFDGEAEL